MQEISEGSQKCLTMATKFASMSTSITSAGEMGSYIVLTIMGDTFTEMSNDLSDMGAPPQGNEMTEEMYQQMKEKIKKCDKYNASIDKTSKILKEISGQIRSQ